MEAISSRFLCLSLSLSLSLSVSPSRRLSVYLSLFHLRFGSPPPRQRGSYIVLVPRRPNRARTRHTEARFFPLAPARTRVYI